MDRIDGMTSFVKVVESGGFSAAARRLNLSPTVVSSHIQALEDRLGARLLNRTTRKVSLTETGKAYYERCVQILSEIEDADRAAGAQQQTPRGTLRLNVSPALAEPMGPVIAEYVRHFPEAAVDMHMSDRLVDMVEEGFDLAVRMTPVAESSLIVRKLASYRHVLCGSPDYLAARGTPREPADLARHNCLNYAYYPLGDEWRFTGPKGVETVRIAGNFRTNAGAALRAAALLGQGLVLMPGFMLQAELAAGRLVPVLTEFLATQFDITAFYPHRRHLSAKVRSFIDLAIPHFAQGNS